MSDASEVKRYFIETITGNTCAVYEEMVDGLDSYTEMVTASDHDRIVAELKTDVARLYETVRYLESTNPQLTDAEKTIAKLRAEVERQREAYESALENHVDMQLTIARQARVIEGVKSALNNHATRPSDALIQIREAIEREGEGT